MKNRKKGPNIFNELSKIIGEEKAKELLDAGCEFKKWRNQARKYQERLSQYKKDDILGGIIEGQWEEISYLDMSRDEYYSLRDSPLEILSECILGDTITYPPPEILMVIANQFKYYMAQEGEVSLESALFGDSRGRGIYAKRVAIQEQKYDMYKKFDAYSKSKKGKGKSQEQILTELSSTPHYLPGSYLPNPFYEYANEVDDWIDSFLRDYRRWKKKNS